MVKSKVSFQMAHFSLEHTLVVVRGSIRGTHRLLVGGTIIYTYAPRIPGTKRLTNSEVVTGNVDAWIKICERKCAQNVRFWGLLYKSEQNRMNLFTLLPPISNHLSYKFSAILILLIVILEK